VCMIFIRKIFVFETAKYLRFLYINHLYRLLQRTHSIVMVYEC
jgi:hypothetical protein